MLGEDLAATIVATTADSAVAGPEIDCLVAAAPTREATARRSPPTMRSSLALIEPRAFVARAEHQRRRFTGGTLDSELRRFEPEISQAHSQATQRPQYPQWGSSSPQGDGVDGLSR